MRQADRSAVTTDSRNESGKWFLPATCTYYFKWHELAHNAVLFKLPTKENRLRTTKKLNYKDADCDNDIFKILWTPHKIPVINNYKWTNAINGGKQRLHVPSLSYYNSAEQTKMSAENHRRMLHHLEMLGSSFAIYLLNASLSLMS